MKKLLIASTALVASAGIASADITITGSANAGYYSGLDNKSPTAAIASAAAVAATSSSDLTVITAAGVLKHYTDASGVQLLTGETIVAGTDGTAIVPAVTAVAASRNYTSSGVYSNAGIDFGMSGATDNGITFAASISADAGTEIDQGDFEFDGADGATMSLGSVSMSGAFGTVTFDDGGIDNLYDDGLTAADISYSTTVGAVSLTIAADADSAADGTSVSVGYTAGAMAFSGSGSSTATDNSMAFGVTYTLNDSISLSADTDSTAGASAINSVSVTTALNGVSITAATDSASDWDIDLGYSVSGIALAYGTDENNAWDASATYALGGGATVKAGVNSESSAYAGVAFAF